MTAPERIWLGKWWSVAPTKTSEDDAEYVRADLAAVPAQVRVKPLVWDEGDEPDEWRSGPYDVWCELGNFQVYHWSIVKGDPHETAEAAKAAAQADYDARIFAAIEPQPDQAIEIDIRAAMMEEIEKAAAESPWVPKEYYMNEVISDCCAFLREDRSPQPDPRDAQIAALVEALTKLRDLMCEAIEDDDGNSGCGQCENDCTGCIAHAALAAAKAVQHG